MSDSDDSNSSSGIPAWQREQQQDSEPKLDAEPASQETTEETPAEEKLDIARRFLQDDEIKNEPREKKEEFLTSKGLTSTEIEELLGSNSAAPPAQDTAESEPVPAEPATVPTPGPHSTTPQEPQPTTEISLPRNDNPPVVTYPEFLTKPTRPPPLITANGIFNTLYVFAGISTLVYGTSKFLVAPMVENLNEARTELHDATSQKLSAIIEKLESTVSEIPPPTKTAAAETQKDDVASEIDDPSEMFHRDIGTQTSNPPTPGPWGTTAGGSGASLSGAKGSSTTAGAKLSNISGHAKTLRDGCVAEAEDLAHLKSEMDLLKDDLMQMAYPAPKDFTGGLYGYRSNEPDDEIKKAKDNIRRVKGVLLSTRNFPTTVR
ncbi:peroxin 14 17 [Colletotrichum karsti]|uniref:Peroxisomal membrane protein PEX14 n=1 Tax=Colletotrichum karsti TaxID=1095194 RepID=A0A9P6LNH7_9PEZI|nr:peroxin 14 17 [Colletotrichum karsti]KAF9878537.1 peroxin 14 17 [Colletotrichum karsti]